MIRFWLSARVSRTDFVAGLVAIAALYLIGLYALTGGLALMLNLGLRTDPAVIGIEPPSVTALRLVCDILLIWFVMRRLRDFNRPGAWAFIVLAAALVPVGGGLLWLSALIALAIVPGTIGPNRFGPDPRGWRSRAHYDEQQRRLSGGEP